MNIDWQEVNALLTIAKDISTSFPKLQVLRGAAMERLSEIEDQYEKEVRGKVTEDRLPTLPSGVTQNDATPGQPTVAAAAAQDEHHVDRRV